MLYKTVRAIIFRGDRVEKGKEIELSAEDVERLGDDVAPVESAAAPAAPEPEPAIEDMTYDQLKAKAKELELSQAGSKADLIERITLHLQGKMEAEMVPHIVTEEDLIANPELVEKGVQVGDEIMLPKEEAPDTNS